MEMLQERYRQYAQAAAKAWAEAKPADGLFGMGEDPRKDPCHMAFYEDTARWVREFLDSAPSREAVYTAVRYMLEAPARYRQEPGYWFLFAAQGLTREMIPLLDAQQCAALREMYDETYPKVERMPVHKDVYKLLSKGADRREGRRWF